MDISIRHESWPIRGAFRISRGSKTTAEVIVAEISDGAATGRGEAVPYARYGETVEESLMLAREAAGALRAGATARDLPDSLPAGAARSVLDCALWDLAAKRDGLDIGAAFAARLAVETPPRRSLETAFTISLDTPEAMARAAAEAAERPLLKVKLGDPALDVARMEAIRASRPDARLIADANEGWSLDFLKGSAAALAALDVALIEQPLPAGEDEGLAGWDSPIVICADESLHIAADLDSLAGRYGAINVKLDKTGGVSAALELIRAARARNLQVMLGCMVGTSLAMAPACRLAEACGAEFVDLDGPLLLARDREPGLIYQGGVIAPCPSELWG